MLAHYRPLLLPGAREALVFTPGVFCMFLQEGIIRTTVAAWRCWTKVQVLSTQKVVLPPRCGAIFLSGLCRLEDSRPQKHAPARPTKSSFSKLRQFYELRTSMLKKCDSSTNSAFRCSESETVLRIEHFADLKMRQIYGVSTRIV